MIASGNASGQFYVYQLIDPRTGLPFYVGKGQGDRAWQHQRHVERQIGAHNSRKVDRIREILIAGFNVEVEIVAYYDLESDALDHEYRLVDSMPTLTNVAEGGAGGKTLTPEQRAKRLAIREKRIAAAKAKELEVRRRIYVERKRREFLSDLGGHAHADEINAWADGGFNIEVAVPPQEPRAPLEKPAHWDQMSQGAQRRWRQKRSKAMRGKTEPLGGRNVLGGRGALGI